MMNEAETELTWSSRTSNLVLVLTACQTVPCQHELERVVCLPGKMQLWTNSVVNSNEVPISPNQIFKGGQF